MSLFIGMRHPISKTVTFFLRFFRPFGHEFENASIGGVSQKDVVTEGSDWKITLNYLLATKQTTSFFLFGRCLWIYRILGLALFQFTSHVLLHRINTATHCRITSTHSFFCYRLVSTSDNSFSLHT